MYRLDFDRVFSEGVDFDSRTVYIHGEIDATVSMKAIVAILMLERTSGAIHIVMNVIGGDVEQGFAIYDTIKSCKNHVTVTAIGNAQSMGAILLQAGDLRRIAPNACFMIHHGTVAYEGNQTEASEYFKNVLAADKRYCEILAKRSRKTLRRIRTLCDKETHYSGEEAVKNGFADELFE